MKLKPGLIVGLALLAACTLGQPSPTPLPEGDTANAPPTEAAAPLPSPTPFPPTQTPPEPTPADTPAELPPGKPLIPLTGGAAVVISEIAMFSPENGWAVGGLADPGDHILQTSDGGQTWVDVSPPEPVELGQNKRVTAYFLDEQTAWVIYTPVQHGAPLSPPVIWHTQDGGENWAYSDNLDIGDLDENFYPLYFSFPDAQHGWLLVEVGVGMSHQYIALFRTQDGGQRWERLLDPYNSSDLHICYKTGMAFIDANNGWVTWDCGGVMPGGQVSITQDGGQSWTQVELPIDPALTDAPYAYCASQTPHLFSPTQGLLGATCYLMGEDEQLTHYNYVCHTSDGGYSWRQVSAPGGQLLFFTPETGFSYSAVTWGTLDTRQLTFTLDGGGEWRFVNEMTWEAQFSFVDPQIGWAVARANGEIALVHSSDGGASWHFIEPIISP